MDKLKVLHIVENYYPSIGGMQEVVRQLSERMSSLGHEIHVATSTHPDRKFSKHNNVTIHSFNISGSAATGIYGDPKDYIDYVLHANFDIVVFFAAQIWSTDLLLPQLQNLRAKTIFVPTGFSGMPIPIYQDYYEKMKIYMPLFDHHIFLSYDYRDIRFAKSLGIKDYTIIPNGADEKEFNEHDQKELRVELGWNKKDFIILHIGSFTGLKGQLEAIRIFNKANLPNSKLIFIGNGYEGFPKYGRQKILWAFEKLKSRFLGRKVQIHQWNRHQTVKAFQSANLFLFPSNIECSPIVLFEAMAAGVPFLASNVGNISEMIEWSQAGEIVPTTFDACGYGHVDINAAASQLKDLYQNHSKRRAMQIAGKSAFKARFNWKNITDSYLNLYHELAQKK